MGPALKSGLYTQWDSLCWRKIKFSTVSSYKLQIVSGLGMQACVTSLFSAGIPFDLDSMGSMPRPLDPCLLPQSLWVQMFVILMRLEGLVSFVSSIPSSSYNLSASSSSGFPKPQGRGSVQKSCWGLSVKRSFTPQILRVWVSVFLPIYYRRKCLLWWVGYVCGRH